MTSNLPATLAFDLSPPELEQGLEHLLRQVRIQTAAFQSYAFETEAARHWIGRVGIVPRNKIDKYGYLVALVVGFAARQAPSGHLEVRQSATDMARRAKLVPGTFIKRLDQIANLALLDILERGSGNGHPFHLRLLIWPEHHQQIRRQAEKSIRAHLEAQTISPRPVMPKKS